MLDVGTQFDDDLVGWLEERGLTLTKECAKRAVCCVEIWKRHESALNIVSRGTAVDQLEASTAAVLALRAAGAVRPFLDVGAGGGFPGLWVAACEPCEGILVEPRARRADFLELSLAAMGRRDWKVVRARLVEGAWAAVGGETSELALLRRSRAGVASARAVWDAETWWSLAADLVEDEGLVMMHVRPGERNPEGAVEVSSSVIGAWEVRLLRRTVVGHGSLQVSS